MAGKKFDLGSYKTDTSKTQVKHNKYSAFLENENSSSEDTSLKNSVSETAISDNSVSDNHASDNAVLENTVSDNHASEKSASKKSASSNTTNKKTESSVKSSVPNNSPEPIRETSELNAHVPTSETLTAKRINMAFSDANYRLISEESERLSVSFVYFINSLIRIVDEKDIGRHIGAMTIRRSKDNISRRKGKPAKRINLKFSPELHSKLSRGAECYNMTITQYMNTIIEVYAQRVTTRGEAALHNYSDC